jgi:hypothetical protein
MLLARKTLILGSETLFKNKSAGHAAAVDVMNLTSMYASDRVFCIVFSHSSYSKNNLNSFGKFKPKLLNGLNMK